MAWSKIKQKKKLDTQNDAREIHRDEMTTIICPFARTITETMAGTQIYIEAMPILGIGGWGSLFTELFAWFHSTNSGCKIQF